MKERNENWINFVPILVQGYIITDEGNRRCDYCLLKTIPITVCDDRKVLYQYLTRLDLTPTMLGLRASSSERASLPG